MYRGFKRPLLVVAVALLALALALVAVGCGEKTTETTATTAAGGTATTAAGGTETTAAGGTETTAASGEVITLKYADQNAVTGWEGANAATPWLDQIEQACGGKVKIERFFGQTLMTGKDTWEGLKSGVADFAWCMHGYWANLTPLADVVTLPFLPYDKGELGGAVLWQLYQEFPALAEQFKDNHPVLMWTSSPYYLLTTKKPVYKPEDMKGLKIRALGGPPTQLVEALGGVAVSMPMPDTYQALQTGVLDGILTNWESLYSFRHYEVGKYLTLVPFHTAYFSQSFSNKTWNSLPDDVKAAIESVSGLKGSMFWGRNMFDTCVEAIDKIIAEKGIKLERIEPSEEEIKTLWEEKYGRPMWDEWVKKMEAAGHKDAQAILDRCLELIAKGIPQA